MSLATPISGPQPFTVGHVFRKGHIPSATAITSSVSQFQADVRTRWSDGSVRFAVLSGVAAAGSLTIIRGGTPYAAANVAEPNIEATVAFTSVIDASGNAVAGGSFAASLSAARSNGSGAWARTTARRVRQIPGPVMSEFHYFVPTADAHTHVWFYVRAYSTGQIEVETVVENGWLRVASPGRRTYNVTVTVGTAQRYSVNGLVHYHHTRWSRVDWIGTDPQVTPRHDVAYLQSTNVVPTYAVTALDSAAYTAWPENGTKHSAMTQSLAERPMPFSLANIDPALGGGGDTDMYGIVPGWAATYLVEGHAGAFWSCVANGRALGRFCLHYRDENDGGPFRGSVHPSLGLADVDSGLSEVQGGWSQTLPVPTGGVPSTRWAYTHSPAAAFIAATLTGRWLFVEEMQFLVGTAELQQGLVWGGHRAQGWWAQNREIAWKFRDRIQAEIVTPQFLNGVEIASGSEVNQRVEAVGRITASVDMTYDYYIAGTSTSPPTCARGNVLGLPYQNADYDTIGGSNADNEHVYSGLMTSMYITSFLYGFDSEPNVTAATMTKLLALAGFFGKWPVGMLGAAPGQTTWDWRVCTFVSIGFGSPGALRSGDDPGGRTVYRASWDAQWTAMRNNFTWQTGTWPVPADSFIRTIRFNESASSPALRFSTMQTLSADTNVVTFLWAANYAHKVADRAAISGAETAIARLHGSDTWKNGLAGLMRTRPEFAVTTDR